FVVADGVIEEIDQTGPVALYATGASFDSMALINGRSENAFVSRDRSLCYQMPVQLFHALSRSNARFREYFQRDLGRRLDALVAVQQQREASSFLLARLGEGFLHPPVFVPPETTIREATRLMQAREVSAVLVRRGNETGIFTDRDVRERSLLMGLPDSTPIGDLGSYDLCTIDREDFLFNALVLMTERAIRHVVVTRGGEIEGIFGQADLLGYLANSSYVIASKLDRARNRSDLDAASASIPHLVRSLFGRGVKPRYIARIVTDLNRKLFRRVFEQTTPPALHEGVCLMVMGSEGRGEQLLRTDQDNGLIFRAEPSNGERLEIAAPFSRTLIELGYPPCPGDVMVTNPIWSQSLATYRRELRHWLAQPTGDAFLKLAILYDASPVAGDAALLIDLKALLFELLGQEEAFAGHFAKATLAFPTPLGLLNRFVYAETKDGGKGIDIKKGGIFPIVHGVRSLALEYRVTETNTISRIQALSGRGPFSEDFNADLIEAFDFMGMLRLRQQFAALDRNQPYDNILDVEQLRGFERNLLRDSLKIVKQFKSDVSHHFRLNMLS
ncbi:MAG TPA: putative nucleotidyltransferase substrate binding domain-containing protein, partial [Rhodospirillales bacterium]|nr:putative nucleotidyltransferase substrate binding domain-containing protein [Rhodospirillales bacterium]